MTTFFFTLGTDHDSQAIVMLDASNALVGLADVTETASVVLPWGPSRDVLLQVRSLSADVSMTLQRTGERLTGLTVLPWYSEEPIGIDVVLGDTPLHRVSLSRNPAGTEARAASTIAKFNGVLVEEDTSSAQTGPGHGDFPLAASPPRVRVAFFDAVERLVEARIELPSRAAESLVALAARGHERAEALARHANLDAELARLARADRRGATADGMALELEVGSAARGLESVRGRGRPK